MPDKVLLLGIDGATFDNLLPYMETGRLPFLRSIADEGTMGHLRSTIQPVTPPAWTAMICGKNPGKTGIYDFFQLKAGGYNIEYTNSSFRKSASMWDVLGNAGKTSGIHNVPMTYPVDKVNGFMISGLGTPGKNTRFTYPEGLKDELTREFGDYRLFDYHYDSKTKDEYVRRVMDYIDENVRVSKYLIERHPTDFVMTVFMSIDHLQHGFLHFTQPGADDEQSAKYRNVLLNAYERLDKGLAELASCADFSHVMVVSDHGFSTIRWFVDLNKYLEEEGFLKFNGPANGASNAMSLLGRTRLFARMAMPKSLKNWITRKMPNLKNSIDSALVTGMMDWKNTAAFAIGTYGNIRINLMGMEPMGIVPHSEYRSTCERIKQSLLRLKDPETDETVVERVYSMDEIYSGECLENAPDLLLKFKDYKYYAFPKLKYEPDAKVFYKRPKEMKEGVCLDSLSEHAENGIFMVKGRGVRKGHRIEDARIIDVMPTVLYLMGAPIPQDLDGRVLTGIFEQAYAGQNTIRVDDTFDGSSRQVDFELGDDEKEEIEKKLKGLGYM